jgi:hypothetical protein
MMAKRLSVSALVAIALTVILGAGCKPAGNCALRLPASL